MPAGHSRVYRFGPFEAHGTERRLLRDGEPVRLPPKVFDLLLMLLEHPGRLVSKPAMLDRVWPGTFVEESALAQSMFLLRRALGESADGGLIETVPKHGYRFAGDVRLVDDAAVAPPDVQSQAARALDGAPQDRRDAPSRVAILPFQAFGSAASDAHLGLAMADALITRLSSVRDFVVCPTSAVSGRGDAERLEPAAIGRSLRVQAVVDGSVQLSGDRVRVNVRLIQVSDEAVIWAEGFDERWTDIFTVQDKVADRVAEAVAPALARDGRRLPARQRPANPAAYLLYSKAVYLTHRGTAEHARRAISYYWRAIDVDPGFARAYAGIATAYCWLSHLAVPPAEAMPKARSAALTALDLEPDLADAHYALALVHMWYEWDFAGAERSFRRALEAAPHHPAEWFGYFLAAMGRFDEALAACRHARAVDPLSLQVNAIFGWALYFARRFDEADGQFSHALELDAGFRQALWGLGWTDIQRGRFATAIRVFERARELAGDSPEILAGLGHAYAAAGDTARAESVLAQMEAIGASDYVSAFYPALVYAGLGDADRTLACLERACAERFEFLVHVSVDPVWRVVESDPRFAEIQARIGLPPRSEGRQRQPAPEGPS